MKEVLTDTQHDDQDHKGVHHRKEGGGDGGEHLRQLVHSPKEPHNSKGPHQPHQPIWDVERPEVHKRHDDDKQIQPIPPASHKRARQIGEHIYAEFCREYPREGEVYVGDEAVELAVAVPFVLRVQNANDEILLCRQD